MSPTSLNREIFFCYILPPPSPTTNDYEKNKKENDEKGR